MKLNGEFLPQILVVDRTCNVAERAIAKFAYIPAAYLAYETSSFQLAITPVLVQTCVLFQKQPLIASDSSAAAYQPAGGYYG